MYYDARIETLSRSDLAQLQLTRLRQTIARAQQAPYYRELFAREAIGPDSIRSLDDLRRIPFATKQTLRDQYPYGLLAVPREQVVRMHSSSGTTGRATVIFHTAADIDAWTRLVTRCMYMAGVRAGDVFQNMTGYTLFTGGLGFHYGGERLGCMVIPVGPGNTRRQITMMREFETTVLHVIPSYALHLVKALADAGLDPRTDLNLRIVFLGAEPHSEQTRCRVQDALGVQAFNSYGLSAMNGPGVAFECPERQGMHVWEDSYILELVDPVTLEPVPEGAPGELVLTTLCREGMPILRYRTRDITHVVPGPCACGRTHRRISRLAGRSDDMLVVKGVNIYPVQIETVLMAIPEVGSNYLIVLDTKDGNDRLTVRVEVTPETFAGSLGALDRLRSYIIDRLRSETLVTPRVELVEPHSLPRSEGKAQRVQDNRAQWGD